MDVLIADEDRSVRDAVAHTLCRAGFRVREAGSGTEALELARADAPGLVLLDVRLPDMCGYLVCKVLRDEFGDAMSIVLLSGAPMDRIDRTAGLLIGADDYLAKPVVLDELLARVRRLRARAPETPRTIPAAQLTPREREVLQLLAEQRQPREIGVALGINPALVETHVQRVLKKLGFRTPAEAIAWAGHAGVLPPESHTALDTSPLDPVGTS